MECIEMVAMDVEAISYVVAQGVRYRRVIFFFLFFQAEDGIRNLVRSRGLGDVYKRQGQRIMLRAGLTKLRKLEGDFAKIDPARHPKMLVVCEDTTVTPLVSDFLRMEGLNDDEVLRVDSNKKGELKPDEWKVLRAVSYTHLTLPTGELV